MRDDDPPALTPVTATAPGKVMLAGEYAVLDGGRAIVAAVDRRVVATVGAAARGEPLSDFLQAARAAVERDQGEAVARAFDQLTVDSAALREGERKLGLGSSAASTVAAISAALAAHDPDASARVELTRTRVARLATAAHAAAQEARGARGSGADVAASAAGGVIAYRMPRGDATEPTTRKVVPPADLRLTFAWTGAPADTAALVAAVSAARAASPAAVDAALTALADAADELIAATTADAAVAALARGGEAMTRLAEAAGVPLVPPSVAALADRLAALGAAAKTTGAGGGDVVLIASPAHVDRNELERAVVETGLWPLSLALDPTGVDFPRPRA